MALIPCLPASHQPAVVAVVESDQTVSLGMEVVAEVREVVTGGQVLPDKVTTALRVVTQAVVAVPVQQVVAGLVELEFRQLLRGLELLVAAVALAVRGLPVQAVEALMALALAAQILAAAAVVLIIHVLLVVTVGQVSLSSVISAHNVVVAVVSLLLAAIPFIHLIHRGHLQHESLCKSS
jgi:hypothetical protein